MDYKENIYDLIKNINYTNYKIVFFCEELREEMVSNVFVDYVSTSKKSKNEAIFDYCKNIPQNDIVLFTDEITEDMLSTLNTVILNNKPRIVSNSKWFEKSFKYPYYWCCKNYIIRELYKQINKKDIDTIELLQALGDISGSSNIIIKELFPIQNNILSIDNSNRNKYKYVSDTIHVIMATYERNCNLEIIFNSLCDQTEKKFHFHLLDNNIDRSKQKEIDVMIERFSEKLHISLHRYNYNYHCIARLHIIQHLIKIGFIEYVIVFDDDQLHHHDWIETMVNQKSVLSILSWYGKIFDNKSYWFKGSNLKKILTYTDIERRQRRDVKKFKYFGPGGCIFDINLFLFNELFHYQKYSDLIFKLDDIWLSFVLDKYVNIPFNRMVYHPKECINRNDLRNTTWAKCKIDKPLLFNHLSEEYGWDILQDQEPLITVNTFFSKVYVIFRNSDELLKTKEIFLKMNISACFVSSKNRKDTICDIFKSAVREKTQSILIFNQNIVFHKFFHHLFHKYVKNIPDNWDILYLGQDTIKMENEEGFFPLTQDVTGLHGVGYSINSIETLLSYDMHNKVDVLHDNKIVEQTVLKNQYFIHPGLVVNNIIENDKFEKYNLIDTIDIPITIYLIDIDNIPNFNYHYCIFKPVQDISNCKTDYFVIINNKPNCYYDVDIIKTGIYNLITLNKSKHIPRQCCIETVDIVNYSLWCNYIKYTHQETQYDNNNNMAFYIKGEKVRIPDFETLNQKKIFIF